MWSALGWWLLIELIGLAALPLTARLLRFLPGRGVALSKQVGLLLAGYLFWLLGVLRVAENTPALAWVCILALAAVSCGIAWGQRDLLRAHWQQTRTLWLAGELVFGVAYIVFCVFRAHNPEIAATEKPMELAFINGILRSGYFPPRDPWLSGYAISYYYGGYALTAMLTRALGSSSAITFNLTNVTLFALTASGAFGVVAELALSREQHPGAEPQEGQRRAIAAGLVGALVVAAMGNLEGVFELLRAHGGGSEALWRWLDVRNLGASAPSAHWYPDDQWWWWRASRIIHDRDAAGNAMEVISEFPFFSFLLGDNHPHVYALPFGLLALALSFNVLVAGAVGAARTWATASSLRRGAHALLDGIVPGVGPWDWAAWAVLLGALGFYNTWDLPVHLAIFCCAAALGLWQQRESVLGWLSQVLSLGLVLLIGGVLLYLPFYWGLRSQAGGLGLVTVKTQVQQFGLMFGTLLWPLFGAAGLSLVSRWRSGTLAGKVALLILVAGAVGAGLLGWWAAAVGLLLAGAAAWLSVRRGPNGAVAVNEESFVWLLALAGALLTVLVEFVYLRDVFDSRMNTVFKFYYQAWLLLGVSGAYALYWLATAWRSGWQRLLSRGWLAIGAVLVAAGLTYTVAAGVSKAGGFAGEPTLDGAAYLAVQRPQMYAALRWLEANAPRDAIMVEATGGSYSEYNAVSAHTGIPTLLGWGGHELQWRGSYDLPGQREPDVAAFYQTNDPDMLRALAARQGVDYVWLGRLERAKYGVTPAAELALRRAFVLMYENDEVIVYGTLRAAAHGSGAAR